jgi:hypothetical protein
MSAPDRRAMLDRADKSLSVRRQCALLSVARSGVYRAGKPANDGALMRRIDELFTAWPFLGSRQARGACVAAVEHDGRFVLSGGARGGSGEVRQARDFQHRPRLAVHFGALHPRARRSGRRDLHGRPRPLDGQRLHRTAVGAHRPRADGGLTECPCRLKRPPSRFGLCGGRGRLKGTARVLTESYPLAWKMIRSDGSFLGEKRELYRLGHPVSGSRSPDGNLRLPQTDHWGRRSGRE